MFVLFYLQLRWFDPSQAGEMRRGRGGGFVSFSEGKETKDRAASFSFAPSASPFPCFPPPPPSPSCSPPRIGIHPYPYLSSPEERKRSGLLCLLLRGEETEERAPLLSLAPFPFSFPSFPSFSSFPSYSPCYPPPPGCVCCCVFPDGLIVVFVCFVRSPARLPN